MALWVLVIVKKCLLYDSKHSYGTQNFLVAVLHRRSRFYVCQENLLFMSFSVNKAVKLKVFNFTSSQVAESELAQG